LSATEEMPMSTPHDKPQPPEKAKRPYARPAFERSVAFERSSLACSGVKNTSGFPVGNCSMQS